MHGEQSTPASIANGPGDILRHNFTPRREHDHALDEVPQLANIAGPWILDQQRQRIGRQTVKWPVVHARELRHKPAHENGDVVATLTKRREIDPQHVQAIVQVGAETTLLDMLAQRPVCRRHNAHIDGNRLPAANTRHFTLLEHAQQLHLRTRRHLANLVEKERAGISEFKTAQPALCGTGERSLLMPEQLALEQRFRQRTNIHRNERLAATRTETMNRARDQLLPGATLPFDQHSARHGRDLFDLDQDFANGLRFAN